MTQPKILITGASGLIGNLLSYHLAGRYELVLTDRRPPKEPRNQVFIEADIADLDSMRSACQGIDIVIHLAGNPLPDAPWESLLPANIVGVYNVFQAAHEAGCRRVIYASSVNAVLGYPEDVEVTAEMPARPANLYGATKVWGEGLARLYADQMDLSCICLRIGWVKHHDDPFFSADNPVLNRMITYRDLVKLFVAAIEAPDDLRFGIFHGISNNRAKRFDISNAQELLGYQPEDDSFFLAEVNSRKPWLVYWRRALRRFRRMLVKMGLGRYMAPR